MSFFDDYQSQSTLCFDGVSSPISVSDYHRPPHAVSGCDLGFCVMSEEKRIKCQGLMITHEL